VENQIIPGIALPIYLFLRVTIRSQASSARPFNCVLSYSYKGDDAKDAEDAESVSLDPKVNLITRVALYVLGSHGQRAFPVETHIEIVNKIPLGRGLGSSAAAVTAGAVLANEVGRLGLDKARILDYCLMIGKATERLLSYG
jgi:homoserine kinase